jgi:uncharacterized protein
MLSKGRENPVFNLLDVAVIVLAAVLALIASVLIATIVYAAVHSPGKIDPKELATNAVFIVPVQVAAYVFTIGFMVLYIWIRYRTSFLDAIGWNMPAGKAIGGALLGGIALALTSGFLESLLHRWIPKSLPFEEFFRTPASAYALAAFGILVAPLVEEIFFRGLLYPALARPMGVGLAVVVTSALFALVHGSQLANAWAPLLVLFVIGSALTIVRAVTRSVATCVVIHMTYNLTLFTILFFQTQGFRHMERAS